MLLGKKNFFDENNNKIEFKEPITKTYILCILSDHFPAIGFQTRQFLKKESSDPYPLVTDIFMLDAFVEFLCDPFDFLFYIHQRIELMERIFGEHEFNVLAYHLSQKLWIEDNLDIIFIHTSVGKELDQEFVCRRIGLVNKPKPFGLLGVYRKGFLGKIIAELKKANEPAILDVIFFIFLLSSEAAEGMCKGIQKVTSDSVKKGRGSDFSFLIGKKGFAFICDKLTIQKLRNKITNYTTLKKYKTKAEYWITFGKTHSSDKIFDCLLILSGPWEFNQKLENLVSEYLPTSNRIAKMTGGSFQTLKVGRNQPCPCGSGKKYKKCCGR